MRVRRRRPAQPRRSRAEAPAKRIPSASFRKGTHTWPASSEASHHRVVNPEVLGFISARSFRLATSWREALLPLVLAYENGVIRVQKLVNIWPNVEFGEDLSALFERTAGLFESPLPLSRVFSYLPYYKEGLLLAEYPTN